MQPVVEDIDIWYHLRLAEFDVCILQMPACGQLRCCVLRIAVDPVDCLPVCKAAGLVGVLPMFGVERSLGPCGRFEWH